MAAKCNIIGAVLDKLYELQYGLDCENQDNIIVENYIQHLDCDIDFTPCYPTPDCENTLLIHDCKLTVKKINIISKGLITIVYGAEIIGGKEPYTYSWEFDSTDFDSSGPINQDESTLTVKINKDLSILVSPISLTVMDAEGCIDVKTCILTPTGLICNDNYRACPNVSNLVVRNNVVFCAPAHNLVLSKV